MISESVKFAADSDITLLNVAITASISESEIMLSVMLLP